MRAFITGITGTLGSIVSKRLLEEGHSVTGLSRDECKQAAFPKHERLTLYLGDIRDGSRLQEAMRGADVVFHFAALKHVDQLEVNPEESVRTNIDGTTNVLHAQRMLKIPRVVFTSTDKAAYPVNVYGMSKGVAERLVLRNPNNVVCRYGNVLASRGSVIESFTRSLREKGEVAITDENMTRFWITPDDAALFVMACAKAKEGGLKIPPMKAAALSDIAYATARVLGVSGYNARKIPVRAGEKTHECLRTDYEGEPMHSHLVPRFSDAELVQVLRPIVEGLS